MMVQKRPSRSTNLAPNFTVTGAQIQRRLSCSLIWSTTVLPSSTENPWTGFGRPCTYAELEEL